LRIEIPEHATAEPFLSILINIAIHWRLLVCKVKVKKSTLQMPHGCIGLVSLYREGLLISQRYLMIPTICYGRTQPVAVPIFPLIPHSLQSRPYNNCNP
jgi:hypothetical protein